MQQDGKAYFLYLVFTNAAARKGHLNRGFSYLLEGAWVGSLLIPRKWACHSPFDGLLHGH
jgi:hypothetical protein